MSSTEAQEAATRQRIVNHMNSDHQDSAFAGKTRFQSRMAKLTNITNEEMSFDCGGQQIRISLDPPLKSLREARERAIEMDKAALQVLKRSDISITNYVPPYVKFGHLYNFTQCALAYVVLSQPSHFQPGSLLYKHFLFRVPTLADFMVRISLGLFALIVAFHTLETFLMTRKLGEHGLTPFEVVWWMWTGSTFVEGLTAFWRLDSLIDEKRREKLAKSH